MVHYFFTSDFEFIDFCNTEILSLTVQMSYVWSRKICFRK